MQNTQEKIYPTTPDEQDHFYENEDDETLGILTKEYPNGSKTKTVKLPRSGKIAMVRSLKAKETTEIARLMDKDPEKYQMAAITVATTIDGKKAIIEEVQEMPLKDYQLLLGMNADLNF